MTLPTQTEVQIIIPVDLSLICPRCHEFRAKHLGIARDGCRDGGEWEEAEQ
jgi:hypothetical protein